MTRWGCIRVASALGAVLLLAAGPASADETCPPLDVSCLSEQATGMAGDVVGDPVGEPPDDPVGSIQHHPVVRPVTDRADQILHGVGSGGPLPRLGGSGDGGSAKGPGDAGSPPGNGGPPQRGRSGFAGGPRGITSTGGDPIRIARPFHRGTSIGARLGRVLAAVAQSLVIALVLFAVTLGFVLVQDRIDRNDPKLAVAPMRPEVILFS